MIFNSFTIYLIKHLERGDHRYLLPILLASLTLGGCATLADHLIADAIITEDIELQAKPGIHVMNPHMTMTNLQPAEPGDRAKAKAIARELEANIQKYRQVEAAVADGYEPFPPEPAPDLKEIHYINRELSAQEQAAINPAKPGALLYHRSEDDSLKLVGAMFTAPATATLDELNQRVPLSVTQWHLHTDICVPKPLWDKKEWARTTYDGQPLYGPDSPVSEREFCESVGGRFAPVIFGWMTHAYVTAEPANGVWDQSFGHSHPPKHQHKH